MEIYSAVVIDGRFAGVICFGVVVGGIIGSIVGAVILRIAAFWAERLDIKYSDAFGTVFVIGLITTGIGLAGGFVMGLNQVNEAWLLPFNIVYVPTVFLLRAALIAKFNNLSFRKGIKIVAFEIMTTIIFFVVIATLALIGWFTMNAMWGP